MDYCSSGVNIAEADKLVGWLRKQSSVVGGSSFGGSSRSRVLSGIGSYAGLFKAVFPGMKSPCLSAGVDGVGTKLKLAVYFQRYKEVGQDLVAMCVNDLICNGSMPLFFMDYYACGKLRQKPAREFLSGVQRACAQSGCVLLGGETAEMPGCYKGLDFDCAGFAVGVVDRSKILGAHRVKTGDRLIGVSSAGFHSNGFSLLRKVFRKDLRKWEKELLEPTALYVSLALDLFNVRGLRAIAHITGGGLDNLLRVLPRGGRAEIKKWVMPAPFLEVQRRAKLRHREMLRTFNCGVGLVLVVSPAGVKRARAVAREKGFSAWDMGSVRIQKSQGPAVWTMLRP